MRLLFDQNLSHRLVVLLADIWPDARHVRDFGLQRADDDVIWRRAKQDGYTLVSKDMDFYQRALLEGPPPKVIWIRIGNCSTDQIADCLRRRAADFVRFQKDEDAAVLILT